VRIAVVGGGSWGSVFATLVRERGHDVTLACRDAAQAEAIAATGHNPRYVRGLSLAGIAACTLGDPLLAEVELHVVAVPSGAFRDVVAALPGGGTPVLSLVKGLDPSSGKRLSRVVEERPVAVLSGPNHAEEIADGLPAAAVIASDDEALANDLQDAVHSEQFRVYVNTDLAGVELCAAAKNVIALGAGAVDGLGMGDNGKAALITRGLAEMTRLGLAAGARPETFAGLAGMGDLIVTCWSRHSRNRRAGELIARGATADEARAEIAMAVEGLTTAPVLRDLAHRLGIELPITEAVCAVLEGVGPREAVAALMGRTPTEE
jgi:glycerol-3-phosphate dehydrogenase (NAD(P)+)